VYLTGPIGRIAENVAVAVVFSLLSTLFIAVSVTPTYVRFILGRVKGGVPLIAGLYKRFLNRYLSDWRLPTFTGILLLSPLALAPFVGGEFLPVLDSDFIYMDVELPPNIAYGGGATETYRGQVFVRLKERAKRRRIQQEIEKEILRRMPPFPGRKIKFLPVERLTMFGMAGTGRP